MKKQDAIARGYVYTGIVDYRRTAEHFSERRAELTRAGYKTLIVNECSGGTPYRSLYAERRYYDDHLRVGLEASLRGAIAERAQVLAEYDEEIANIQAQLAALGKQS